MDSTASFFYWRFDIHNDIWDIFIITRTFVNDALILYIIWVWQWLGNGGGLLLYALFIWWKKRVKLQSLAATDDGVCGVHECSSPVYFNFISSEGYFGRWCWCYSAIHTVNIRLNVDKYSTMYDYHTWWFRVIHILDRAIAGRLVFIIEYTRRY